MTDPEVFDPTQCALGEGPLWHPLRDRLYWFDIEGRKLMSRGPEGHREWTFDRRASAAGWLDRDSLFVATETGFVRLDLDSGAQEDLAPLEADEAATRSNDGRADPFGGFWVGTMGLAAQPGVGAIYRYYKGEVRQLYPGLTVPNAICFAPDGGHAYFTDTVEGTIRRVRLDGPDGWPVGEPEVWCDLRQEGLLPDGAVCDRDGRVWNAQYGAGRVACYAPDGRFLDAIALPALYATCPAFGGASLSDLYVTTASLELGDGTRAAEPEHGRTFVVRNVAEGQAEHPVKLG
ncbi:SMP-30/gluconolactonase/LRE family protein [Rhodobacteraceae bacterium CCMM004]|nr:SMP-30/gluconolactonase/LRE family protein [Rhodobacteraceae bacterium CCMM004]